MCFANWCNTGTEIPYAFGTCTPKYAIFARTFGSASPASSLNTAAFVQRAGFCTLLRLKRFFGIEEDRDWAFIDQLHGHHRLENSCGDVHSQLAKRFAKFFVESSRLFRRRSRDEAWPPLPARIAVGRELGG